MSPRTNIAFDLKKKKIFRAHGGQRFSEQSSPKIYINVLWKLEQPFFSADYNEITSCRCSIWIDTQVECIWKLMPNSRICFNQITNSNLDAGITLKVAYTNVFHHYVLDVHHVLYHIFNGNGSLYCVNR